MNNNKNSKFYSFDNESNRSTDHELKMILRTIITTFYPVLPSSEHTVVNAQAILNGQMDRDGETSKSRNKNFTIFVQKRVVEILSESRETVKPSVDEYSFSVPECRYTLYQNVRHGEKSLSDTRRNICNNLNNNIKK
jgi:hypothetical protein